VLKEKGNRLFSVSINTQSHQNVSKSLRNANKRKGALSYRRRSWLVDHALPKVLLCTCLRQETHQLKDTRRQSNTLTRQTLSLLLVNSQKRHSVMKTVYVRPHRMHEMRTVANDVPVAWASVNQSVSLSVTWIRCANTTELIEVLFEVQYKTGVISPRI